MKKLFAVFITVLLIAILLSGVKELPQFGLENNPANNEVMSHYIEKVQQETGAMNIVTGIILDYRAFDTFIESSVLFTAAAVVIIVLRQLENESKGRVILGGSLILSEIGRMINPFIQILGLYVIIFGHLSPGGGFAGGTILGASLILYRMAQKDEPAGEKLTYKNLMAFLSAGMILYGLLKGYAFINGGSHLGLADPPLGTPGDIMSGGLLMPLNILVGMVVSITMYIFFSLFDRGEI